MMNGERSSEMAWKFVLHMLIVLTQLSCYLSLTTRRVHPNNYHVPVLYGERHSALPYSGLMLRIIIN